MSINRLEKLLPPPAEPKETDGHDWSDFFKNFGVEVPQDYKYFLSVYGTGSIGRFLWVFNPFSKNNSLNQDAIEASINAYNELHKDFPEYYPREKGSFIPWGLTDNGDAIVWIVDKGEPDLWKVAIQNDTEEMTGMTMSEFLVALLEKTLMSSILPAQFLESDKSFSALS